MTPESQRKTGLDRSRVAAKPIGALQLPIGEEHVRFAAYGVFEARVRAGIPGDCVSDWLEAERKLRARQTTVRR
jgi:hypothetical protein